MRSSVTEGGKRSPHVRILFSTLFFVSKSISLKQLLILRWYTTKNLPQNADIYIQKCNDLQQLIYTWDLKELQENLYFKCWVSYCRFVFQQLVLTEMALRNFVTQSHSKHNGNKAAQHQVLNTFLPLLLRAAGIWFFPPKGEKAYVQNRVKCIHSSENWGWTSSRSLSTKPSFSHTIYVTKCTSLKLSHNRRLFSHGCILVLSVNEIKEKCHRVPRTSQGSPTWWYFPQSNKWLFTKVVNS